MSRLPVVLISMSISIHGLLGNSRCGIIDYSSFHCLNSRRTYGAGIADVTSVRGRIIIPIHVSVDSSRFIGSAAKTFVSASSNGTIVSTS